MIRWPDGPTSSNANSTCRIGRKKADEDQLQPAVRNTLRKVSRPTISLQVAGQAAACLHTMSIMQAYQADLLKDLGESDEVGADLIQELRLSADLALRATKETAKSVGRSMAALVATEQHLWLNLTEIKDRDKTFLLDAPLNPSSLFGDAITSVTERFQEVKKQSAALQQFLPRHTQVPSAAGREQPKPSTSSSQYRQHQKQSVATRTPPPRSWDAGKRSQAKDGSEGRHCR
ncbi:hypothetical protein DPX16_3494 [Anabarilius grahami]|uniref:Uncharacterized protein n=1 Tax=Anabarilius grahami TaxID=495550 RepID=A0A3N0Y6N5_ANAGA|nr:hypothetical protein DPX16_3494 [Anabarilius grahami]